MGKKHDLKEVDWKDVKPEDIDWNKFHADRAKEFANRKKARKWPASECERCDRTFGCCISFTHHVGDFCLHCGNDER